jgi:hypothetical protein
MSTPKAKVICWAIRTKATRFDKPNDGNDRMNENDEDVVHAGIVSKSQKILEFTPIL